MKISKSVWFNITQSMFLAVSLYCAVYSYRNAHKDDPVVIIYQGDVFTYESSESYDAKAVAIYGGQEPLTIKKYGHSFDAYTDLYYEQPGYSPRPCRWTMVKWTKKSRFVGRFYFYGKP